MSLPNVPLNHWDMQTTHWHSIQLFMNPCYLTMQYLQHLEDPSPRQAYHLL